MQLRDPLSAEKQLVQVQPKNGGGGDRVGAAQGIRETPEGTEEQIESV